MHLLFIPLCADIVQSVFSVISINKKSLDIGINFKTIIIDHGAVKRSNINKGRMNLIIFFTAKDMDIIIEHIITYVNSKKLSKI